MTNLTVNSTWAEILEELNQLEAEIDKLKEVQEFDENKYAVNQP